MTDCTPGLRGKLREKFPRAHAARARMLDEMRFLRSFARNPLRTGALVPSGPELAARMASFVAPGPGVRVVELGPGTGVVTKALLARGLAPGALNLVEFCPEFCALLTMRHPGLTVLRGDAYDLRRTLNQPGGFLERSNEQAPLDGIVSSLPLLTRPEPEREALLDEALDLLRPGAPFVQFSYGLTAPVRPKGRGISVLSSEWIWKNMPPARVWVYRKGH